MVLEEVHQNNLLKLLCEPQNRRIRLYQLATRSYATCQDFPMAYVNPFCVELRKQGLDWDGAPISRINWHIVNGTV